MKFLFTAKDVRQLMLSKATDIDNSVAKTRSQIIRSTFDDKHLDRLQKEAGMLRFLSDHLGEDDLWLEEHEIRNLIARDE
jgi:hypothetical protein